MYKICFVTTISATLKAFVLDFAKFMHETGMFEVHFVCNYDAEFEKMLPDYIHYKPISMKRGISFDGLKAICEMKKYFKKEKFDLVQYSTPNAACYASIASRLAKIKTRLYCQWGIVYVGFQGVKRYIFKVIEKIICWNSTVIEPDSFGNLHFSQKEKLYTADKSRVIWNGSASGVNLFKFDVSHKSEWRSEIRNQLGIPEDAVVYSFVGRITRDKGINELFAATQALMKKRDNAYLLLVGNTEKSESINTDLYQWSTDASRVIYCGYTNAVEKYLAASDIYLLPSYREGFGSSVVEAESMGMPVIVTDIPGPTDAMRKGETGFVVKKGSITELFEAMEKLYLSKELRLDMGRKAMAFATNCFEQKHLFDKIMQDRLELIQKNLCQ